MALYWIHQYKDLIDHHGLFQTQNQSPNMGFMTDNGWRELTHRTAADFRIGNLFIGADAQALYRTLSASAQNIKRDAMHAHYATQQ